MTDIDLVGEYCNFIEEEPETPFDHPLLAAMRLLMTGADIVRLRAALKAQGEANIREADALRRYGRAKWGAAYGPDDDDEARAKGGEPATVLPFIRAKPDQSEEKGE